jgi:hypothetical protein
MALCFCASIATPALAVADVDEVLFSVTVAQSSEVANEITAEIRVKGTDLLNGSITIPSALGTLALSADGPDLVRGIAFANGAELATFLPPGNYALSVANGTVTATIAYSRPSVPSPAISQPAADAAIAPGPVTVVFTACGAECELLNDSVEARLEDGASNELASETLTASDDSWIPPDGLGGDLPLPEASEFLARITHTAVRQSNVTLTGNPDPSAAFTNTFVQSDEVGFRTGFAPPAGDFCIVVNVETPPLGCSPVDVPIDPQLAILDPGGTVSTSVAGHAVDYTFTVGSKGALTGSALADLDGDGSQETAGEVVGRLKGKAGELRQKLSFPLSNEGLAARLKVKVGDVLSIPLDSLERTQRASGSLGALKVQEETLANGGLPAAPQGWRVQFTIAADGGVQGGLLTLELGRSFPLEGTHKFKLATNLSSLRLQTADKGIKLQLKQVELDDEAPPNAVVGGDLSYKILGQSGKAPLP